MAIAERPTEAPGPNEGTFAAPHGEIPYCGPVRLPPGSVPVELVRSAIRSYRTGVIGAERLIAIVDRHGVALERETARRAAKDLADFHRTVDRAAALADSVSTRLAQLEWLRVFPHGPDLGPVPLRCRVGGGREFEVSHLLVAMRTTQLPARAVRLAPPGARPRRLDARRGASPAMAALADGGISTLDVGLASGIDRRKVWSVLNGHERSPPGLHEALEQLLGADQAAAVLELIPDHPRTRAPGSEAVSALRDAGAAIEDVAPLVPAKPATVRKWLRGTLRPSRHSAAALARALEQLLGEAAATRVLELIPSRNGATG